MPVLLFLSRKPSISLRLKWHILSTLQKETTEVGRLNTLALDRELLRGVCERHNVLFQLIIWSREILEDSFHDLSSRPHREKHHACRKRSLDRHYLSDIRLLLAAGLLQWAVMNCWLWSETEINSPAVHHASVCSAHTSIISGDCLSDGSVYASTSCSPRPEVSGDLKIHEHKRRRSLEDTVAQTATRRQSRTVPEDCLRTCLLEGWKDLQSYFWMRESTYVEHNSVSITWVS